MVKRTILFFAVLLFMFYVSPCWAGNYPFSLTDARVFYVWSGGSGSNPQGSWSTAAKSIQGVTGSNSLTGGDTIYVRGDTSGGNSFTTNDSGTNVHPGPNADKTLLAQAVDLTGSNVIFSTTPSLNPTYLSEGQYHVYIVNSFRGNSGVFQATAINGSVVTVDTSDLPGGTFVDENSSDSPWTLKGAIVRPVRLVGCDSTGTIPQGDRPITSGSTWNLDFRGSDYIFVTYMSIHSASNMNVLWSEDADFCVIDHVDVYDSRNIELDFNAREHGFNNETQTYNIVQHSTIHKNPDGIHDFSDATQEMVYLGYESQILTGYTQFMYNEFYDCKGYITSGSSPDRVDNEVLDGRGDNDYTVFWGNYVHDCYGGKYGTISIGAGRYLIGNNYIANNHSGVNNSTSESECVINDKFGHSSISSAVYILNNILYNNNPDSGSHVCFGNNSNHSYTYFINNTMVAGGSGETAFRQYWTSATVGYLYNNIVQDYDTIFHSNSPSIDNEDNNYYYNYNVLGRSPKGNYYTSNPGLNDPTGEDFTLRVDSGAVDKGTDWSSIFQVDNHNAATPSTLPGTQPTERTGSWDIGAYESGVVGSEPTVQSATIGTDGETVTFTCSENMAIGAGGNGGVTITAPAGTVTLTYDSISGSDIIYTTSRKIWSWETGITFDYTQPGTGNGWEALDDGTDLASDSGSVTNNSSIITPVLNSVGVLGIPFEQ